MSYRVELSAAAEAELEALPPDLQDIVRVGLIDLSADPVSQSRPAPFPFPPVGQLHHIKHDIGAETWHFFTILFRYGQDEETLHVVGIGHVEYPRDEDQGD